MQPKEYEALWNKLCAIEERLTSIEKTIENAAKRSVAASNVKQSTDGAVADDRDLDGQYGDPEIRFDPREKYWSGASYIGQRFSQCPPDYLLATAKYLDACAFMKRKDGDDRKAGFNEKDAARARGWALRNGNAVSVGHAHQAHAKRAPANRPPSYTPNVGGGFGSESIDAEPTGGFVDDDIPFIRIETRWDKP